MTIHASFGGRNAGKAGSFNAGMAVTTINSHPAGMVRMTELDRLLACNLCLCKIRGTVHFSPNPGQSRDNKKEPENGKLRDGIRTVVEDLRHSALYGKPNRTISYKLENASLESLCETSGTVRSVPR